MRATRQPPLAYRRRLSLGRGMIRLIRERLFMRAPSPKNPFAPAEIHRESGAPAGRTDATAPAHTQHLAPAPHPAVLPKAARFEEPDQKTAGADF